MPIFDALKRYLDLELQHNSFSHVLSSLTYAVFDWCPLGLFTRSRINEYGQSKLSTTGVRSDSSPDPALMMSTVSRNSYLALNLHEFPTHATPVNGQISR